MPRRRRFRRKRRGRGKRRFTRRRKRYRSKLTKQIPTNGFPDKIMVSHRYATTVQAPATSSLNDVYYHTFNLSSLWDPDADGTGHQPRGRDALAQVYKRYLVTGAKVTCRPVSPAQLPDGASGVQFGGVVSHTSNLFETNGWVDMIEQWSHFTHRTIVKSVGMSRPLTRTYSLTKFMDHPKPMSDDVVSADRNYSPTKCAYFQLWCATPGGTARPGPITFSVIIEQIAVWFRKEPQAMS